MRPVELSFSVGDVFTVTKKDPNGWWEAEFKGKKGVIPHTFVADYTPPVPVPVPVPVPMPVPVPVPSPVKTQQERKVTVEVNGESRFLKLPVGTLDEFVKSLRDQLAISSSMTVSYFDPEMDAYGILENVLDLPVEKAKVKVTMQAMSWWGWSVDSASWVTKGFETTRYSSLLVKEGPHIPHQPAFDKFRLVATQLGFDPKVATKVFAVSNEKLLTNFEGYRDILYAKHRVDSVALFKKDDWMTMLEAEQRKEFIDWHSDLCGKFSWNDKTRPRVVPMLQGTSEAAAWKICQQGFGVVGKTDDGFYGAGVYFTSKLGYADKYAKSGPDGSKPFIVSMVIPGNSFPVVEHPFTADGSSANPSGFKGKACRNGYQSHLTLVDGRDLNTAFPVRGPIDAATAADELVTFDSSQALPLFVFYTK